MCASPCTTLIFLYNEMARSLRLRGGASSRGRGGGGRGGASSRGRGGGESPSVNTGIIRLRNMRPSETAAQIIRTRFTHVLTARGGPPLTFPQRGRVTHLITPIRGRRINRRRGHGEQRAILEGMQLTVRQYPGGSGTSDRVEVMSDSD